MLWDKQPRTIVNNESADIVRMLNYGFGGFAKDAIDLYPPDLRGEIDALNEPIYPQAEQRRVSRRFRHHAGGL